ncbi:MAG: hypothetical protein C5B51_19810 [Terriglobia bacterium]|nr:MAG: hypothetical protein C5B51_19810 [Terriglobia bacterium]
MLNMAALITAAVVVLIAIAAWRMGSAWLKYRGKRVITCPESRTPAGVSLDVRHAASTALKGDLKLRLTSCSRWPERAGCGQDCVFQIERSPEDCLVRNILMHWYEGKNCAWCGRPIGEIHLAERKPALLTADRCSVEWNQVPADDLLQTLATALPLCFTCHIANTMVREHPEMVIDRSRAAVTGNQ